MTAGSAHTAQESILRPPYRNLTLGIVATVLLVAFEALAVATALPAAALELGDTSLYAWAFSGFFAASLVGIVVGGEASDHRGPRLPFLVGVGAFGAGLVVAGLAENMSVLVAGRVIQGLGGGALIVALYVIVARAYPEPLRPRAFAAMATGWVLPSFAGPMIAAWLAENWSWRAVFLLIPVLVVPAVAVMLPVLLTLDGPVQRAVPHSGRRRRALGAAAGLVVLQYAGRDAGWSAPLLLVVALAVLAVTVPGLLPRGTLRFAPGAPSVVAQRGLLMGVLVGTQAFVPLMLVDVRGTSVTFAGAVLTSSTLSWVLGSWWQGRPSTRTPRWLLVRIGALLLTAGVATTGSAVSTAVSPWVALGGWAVAGLGMGLAVPSISVLLFQVTPPEEHGTASAAIQVADALASVVFVAMAGVLYAALDGGSGAGAAFTVIFAVMAVTAAGAAGAAARIRSAVAPAAR